MKLILASASLVRQEMLKRLNLDYTVIVSDANEDFKDGLSFPEQLKEISMRKVEKVFEETASYGNRIIIGGDQMIVKDHSIYGIQIVQLLQEHLF